MSGLVFVARSAHVEHVGMALGDEVAERDGKLDGPQLRVARAESQGDLEGLERGVGVAFHREGLPVERVGDRGVGIDLDRFSQARHRGGSVSGVDAVHRPRDEQAGIGRVPAPEVRAYAVQLGERGPRIGPLHLDVARVGQRQGVPRGRERRVAPESLLEEAASLGVAIARAPVQVPVAAERELPGREVGGVAGKKVADLTVEDRAPDVPDDDGDERVLHQEHVLVGAVVAIGPELQGRLGVRQAGVDAQPGPPAADAALDDVVGAELGSNRPRVGEELPVTKARAPRDHRKPLPAQAGDEIFGEPVAEVPALVFVFRLQNFERQDGDGGRIARDLRRDRARGAFRSEHEILDAHVEERRQPASRVQVDGHPLLDPLDGRNREPAPRFTGQALPAESLLGARRRTLRPVEADGAVGGADHSLGTIARRHARGKRSPAASVSNN